MFHLRALSSLVHDIDSRYQYHVREYLIAILLSSPFLSALSGERAPLCLYLNLDKIKVHP